MAYIREIISKWDGFYVKRITCLSIPFYKPWLVNEDGSNMRIAYQLNFFPSKNTLRSNISRAASDRGIYSTILCIYRLFGSMFAVPTATSLSFHTSTGGFLWLCCHCATEFHFKKQFCRSGKRLSIGQMCCVLPTEARMWPIRLQSIH